MLERKAAVCLWAGDSFLDLNIISAGNNKMLSETEQIIAARWIWKWLETSRSYDLSDQNLRRIAKDAEFLDGKTEFSVKRITTYLNKLLTDEYKQWASANLVGRKELLVKQRSSKL
jgi:hypothetical protein